MRMIDADALKEKKVYSHERHEKIVPVAEIDWLPTIDAIPVEWIFEQMQILHELHNKNEYVLQWLIEMWQKEQEAR